MKQPYAVKVYKISDQNFEVELTGEDFERYYHVKSLEKAFDVAKQVFEEELKRQ